MTQPITPATPRYPTSDIDDPFLPPPPTARSCGCPAPPAPAANAPRPAPVAAPAAPSVSDTRAAIVQSRLDAFMQAMSGPYQTPDGTLWVPAPFRMSSGYAAQASSIHQNAALIEAARQRAGLSPADISLIETGRGSAAQIHAMTQALIDVAGRPASGGPWTADDVRQLMFDCGIGVDCAGYAQQAHLAADGLSRVQAGLAPPTQENLSGLEHRGFARVADLSDARPGDVVVLGPRTPNGLGHRAIVYDQRAATPADTRVLLNLGPSAASFAVGGPIRVVEVDSSWGSGGNASIGGVGRQTWWYNESTQLWGRYQETPPAGDGTPQPPLFLASSQPYDHPLQGIYRQPSLARSTP